MSKRAYVGVIIFANVLLLLIVVVKMNFFHVKHEKGKDYLNNINYYVPDSFEKDVYTNSVSYHYYGDYNNCSFMIEAFKIYNNYESGEEYLKDNIYFSLNDKISDIREVDINGVKWYIMIRDNKLRKYYYYATIYNGIGYYMSYDILDYNHGDYEDNNNLCNVYYDRIISSVKFK